MAFDAKNDRVVAISIPHQLWKQTRYLRKRRKFSELVAYLLKEYKNPGSVPQQYLKEQKVLKVSTGRSGPWTVYRWWLLVNWLNDTGADYELRMSNKDMKEYVVYENQVSS